MFRILWDPSSGSIKRASLKLLWCFACVVGVWQREIWTCGVCVWCDELSTTNSSAQLNRSKFHAAKHRLRTQNIISNFSEARLILPEDGSQRIRNMSEVLIVF